MNAAAAWNDYNKREREGGSCIKHIRIDVDFGRNRGEVHEKRSRVLEIEEIIYNSSQFEERKIFTSRNIPTLFEKSGLNSQEVNIQVKVSINCQSIK